MATLHRTPHGVRLLTLTALSAAVLSAGCQGNPAIERSVKASDTLVGTRQTMVASEQIVADSEAALRTLAASKGDLRVPFKAYVVQLQAVQKQADRMKDEADAVKAQSAAYCAARQGDVSTISDDAMRAAAQQRTAAARDKCDEIKDRYAKVNAAFSGYVRRLTDLQTYLANELNNGTLDSGHQWVDEALVHGDLLRKSIRDLAYQVEMMTNTLSPVPLAVTQWTTKLDAPEMIADPHLPGGTSVMASLP